jgi:hypothetical protein
MRETRKIRKKEYKAVLDLVTALGCDRASRICGIGASTLHGIRREGMKKRLTYRLGDKLSAYVESLEKEKPAPVESAEAPPPSKVEPKPILREMLVTATQSGGNQFLERLEKIDRTLSDLATNQDRLLVAWGLTSEG